MSPYGVTGLQCVNISLPDKYGDIKFDDNASVCSWEKTSDCTKKKSDIVLRCLIDEKSALVQIMAFVQYKRNQSNIVLRCLIDEKSALVQIMACVWQQAII